MNNHKPSGGWWRNISIALGVAIFLSAGCSSQQASKTDEPPASFEGQGFSQNVLPTENMVSGTVAVPDQTIPIECIGTKSPACPKLDSLLNQVAASPDPLSTAASLNLRTSEGKVQVVLVLASDDPSFLNEFGVEPGSQAGREIQAFIPVDQLCQISNLEKVLTIRVPAEAVLP